MKKQSLIALLVLSLTLGFSSCGNDDSKDETEVSSNADGSNVVTDESSQDISDEELNIKSNEELLANEKNIAGNGIILINDEADYPVYIKDLRISEKDQSARPETEEWPYVVSDIWGNEIFTIETETFLYFSEGLSSYKQNGLFGFVDINGNVVIEPKYIFAGNFINGSCCVTDETGEYFIDKNGERSEDHSLLGFNGDIETVKNSVDLKFAENFYTSSFTGTYLQCWSYAMSDDRKSKEYFFGYADSEGNITEIKGDDISDCSLFYNGYALIETSNRGFYFIDENFQQVTGNLIDTLDYVSFDPVDGANGMSIEFIYRGGYFVSTVYNDDHTQINKQVVKIAPELYESK